MNERLVIDGGPTIQLEIQLEGRPAQGTRHDVFFGVLGDAGERVVVKLERVPGVALVDGRRRHPIRPPPMGAQRTARAV